MTVKMMDPTGRNFMLTSFGKRFNRNASASLKRYMETYQKIFRED